MARILLLTQHFPPETFAAANRITVLASRLAEVHDVTVVTLRPSYPSRSVFTEDAAELVDARVSYRVRRTFHFHPHSSSPLLRGAREHAMALRLAGAALREPADIVLTSSPSMFLGPAALGLARAKRAAFVWDLRDLTWQYAWIVTSRSLAVALGALQTYMWRVARAADLVVAATAGIRQALIDQRVPGDKIVLIPNAVTTDFLRASQGLGGQPANQRPLVSYVGLVGHAQALGTLLSVARSLPDVDFVIAGDGPIRRALEQEARRAGLTNLGFTGYLPPEGVLDVYRRSNILFAQLREHPTLASTGMPSKLFEYMATGRPLVYAGSGLAAARVEAIGCGKTVHPQRPELIRSAIQELLDDPGEMAAQGERGRRFTETTADRAAAAEPLLGALASLSASRGFQ